jgi:protein phosphatase
MQESTTLIRLAARTDTGKVRYHNEDNFLVGSDLSSHDWSVRNEVFELGQKGCLLVVADGMGGANAGEVASQIAVATIKEYFEQLPAEIVPTQEYLDKALWNAHQAIVDHASIHPECKGMGTTALLAWIKGTQAHIGWSGDSRCYKYNPEATIQLLSSDHSLVWEWVQQGQLTEDEAAVHDDRNIITQSLGASDFPPKPDFITVDLTVGDRLLLCSDGLNSMLLDKYINRIFTQNDPLITTCVKLVEAANEAGGEDNITVVMYELIEILEENNTLSFAISPEPAVRTTGDHQLPAKRSMWSWVLVALILAAVCGSGYWWYNQNDHQKSHAVEPISITQPVPVTNSVVKPSSETLSIKKNVATKQNSPKISTKTVASIKDDTQKWKIELRLLQADMEVYQKKYQGFFSRHQTVQSELAKLNTGLTKIENGKVVDDMPKKRLQQESKELEKAMELWQEMINQKQNDIDKVTKLLQKK